MIYAKQDAAMCRALWEAMRSLERPKPRIASVESQSPICRKVKSNIKVN